MKVVLLAIVLIGLMASTADARVKPADYRAMVVALHHQVAANTKLSGGLGCGIAETITKEPSKCFDAPAQAWAAATTATDTTLRRIALHAPGDACTGAIQAFTSETDVSVSGIRVFRAAVRAGTIRSGNLPGYNRVRAAVLSKMPALLVTACAP